MDYEDTKVKNFILDKDSQANAYGKSCGGCQKTGADIMLTFGGTIHPINGNNQRVSVETLRFVDVFLTKAQAKELYKQLGNQLEDADSQEIKDLLKLD